MSRSFALLIVNGTPAAARQVVDVLRQAGMEPDWRRVASRQDLDTALRERAWDVVLFRHEPARSNGVTPREALTDLRARHPQLPFMIVTTADGRQMALELLNIGAQDFFLDGDLSRLAPAVERELRYQKARRRRGGRTPAFDREKFTALLEAIAQAALISDSEGRIVMANQVAEAMFDYDRSDLVGMQIDDLVPEPHRRDHADHRARFLADPEARLMGSRSGLSARRRGGSTFPVEISLNTIQIGDATHVMAFVTDISQRKSMEQALRESETRYRELFEEDLTANILFQPGGRIVMCNPAFARLSGYATADEAAQVNFFSLFPDLMTAEELIDRIEREARIEAGEVTFHRPDGRRVHAIATFVGIFDEEGRLRQIKGYMFDDTRRKEIERQFVQAQKMESLGMLAGGLAHDFNNMISVINACSQILLVQVPEDSPMRRSVELISKTAREAGLLTQQIRTFSRRQEIEPVSLDVNRVVEETSALLHHLIGKHIHLNLELGEGLPRIEADPTQFDQVLMNLAVDARDAMPNGGTLTITTDVRELGAGDLAYQPEAVPGRYVEIAVSDTGVGIPPDIQDKIFEPFFTTKPKEQGTGLGLSTVFGIITQNGGHIAVSSTPGEGTTFRLYLPAVG